ncbi:MAG: chaperone NapD [Gammaproteobacteria bacterium]|jgi:nitrate reductase NapD
MNLSGILVVSAPAHMDAVIHALRGLSGVDVHQQDRSRGRLIVTQEAPSVGAAAEGLQRIKVLPHVITAELVYHRFDEDGEPLADGAGTVKNPPAAGEEDPAAGPEPVKRTGGAATAKRKEG